MAEYDPVARRAAFSAQFQDTPNLDQRRRYAQDLEESAARHSEREKQAFENLQVSRPEIGNMVTARNRENRMAREGINRTDLAERKFQWEQERGGRLETLGAKRLELQMRSEERAIRKQEMDIDRMDRQEEDTLGVMNGEFELRNKFGPGTPQYKQGMMSLFMQHPNVDKDFRRTALSDSGFEDPDQAFEAAQAMLQQNPGSRATIPIKGGGRATIVSPKGEAVPNVNRLDTLRTKIAKEFEKNEEERDSDYLNYLQTQFESEKGKGGSTVETPTTAPANQAPPPTDFQAAAAAVLPGQTFTFGGKTWRKPAK